MFPYNFTLERIEKLLFFVGPYDISENNPFTFYISSLSEYPLVSFVDNDNIVHTLSWDGEEWEKLDINKQIDMKTEEYRNQLRKIYDSDYSNKI